MGLLTATAIAFNCYDQRQAFEERFLVAAAPRAKASLIDQALQILRTQMRLGPVNLVVVARVRIRGI
ncbi:hypothetical protein [Cupriavidus sp. YAF13]|uniref:hypothetical protein n=1 Tax=Cupriavidus sp. YAF13 TaxID=3233075 RepID=UPI003F8FC377